jgi:hypothetical protein
MLQRCHRFELGVDLYCGKRALRELDLCLVVVQVNSQAPMDYFEGRWN